MLVKRRRKIAIFLSFLSPLRAHTTIPYLHLNRGNRNCIPHKFYHLSPPLIITLPLRRATLLMKEQLPMVGTVAMVVARCHFLSVVNHRRSSTLRVTAVTTVISLLLSTRTHQTWALMA